MPEDDCPDDLTVYDLADRAAQGYQLSSAALKEIGAELVRVQKVLTSMRHYELVARLMRINAIPEAWPDD